MIALNRFFHYLGSFIFPLIWINRIWLFYFFPFVWKNYQKLSITILVIQKVICNCQAKIGCPSLYLHFVFQDISDDNMRKLSCPRLSFMNACWQDSGAVQNTDGCITAENKNQEVMTLGPIFLPKKGSLKLTSYASQTPNGCVFFCQESFTLTTF